MAAAVLRRRRGFSCIIAGLRRSSREPIRTIVAPSSTRDGVVLRGAHRQLAQPARGGELAQRGEPAAAVLGRAASGGIVISPTTGDAGAARR